MISESHGFRFSGYDFIAIVSGFGIISWMVTDFYGGMILYLLAHGLIVFPFILLYIFSLFDTLISIIRNGKNTSKIKIASHVFVVVVIIAFNLYHSELFKSARILTANLNDDLYHYRLILRKNGKAENHVSGIFGYSKIFKGKYVMNGNLIIFIKKPYENSFIPDTLLLDKKQRAIFINKGNGAFYTKKGFLNHFSIEE